MPIGRIVAVVLLMIPRAGYAQNSTSDRITRLEVFKENQDSYNAKEHNAIALAQLESENRLVARMDKIDAEQRDLSAKIDALGSSSNDLSLIGKGLFFAFPLSLGAVYFLVARKDRQSEARKAERMKYEKELDERLDKLERSRDLMVALGDSVERSFSSGVHHPSGHPEADSLLDKHDAGDMTPKDKADLDTLLEQRQTDPTVTLREQNMARELPKVIEIMRELREIAGLPEPPAEDRNKGEKG